MADKKTGAAKHSADYRDRKKAEAMKAHGYTQLQELLQDLHRSFLAASSEEQARRLRQPDATAFEISPELARQVEQASRAVLRREPGDEQIMPN
jgi:hypothetical protein